MRNDLRVAGALFGIGAKLQFAAMTVYPGFPWAAFAGPAAAVQVELKHVPEGGIQPQAAVDRKGAVHLVFFKGDPAAGDLFYAQSKDGTTFSTPMRVNSVPGSAVALGNIRGARIALGRRGRVYIVWNGSAKLGDPSRGRSPMLFSRLGESGSEFEPERDLIQTAYGIDGGGGIAADQEGRVYVFWHAPMPGTKGENNRRVWMARSLDDGKTFEPERMAWDRPTGACGCCSLNAYADGAGKIYVLFRSAQEVVHRDMYVIASPDHGASFRGADVSRWNVGYCVMSSEAFASGLGGTIGAWETEKRVHFGRIASDGATATDSEISVSGMNQKYPSLAVNREGLVLVAWTEGMGWKRGGSVHWQVLDRAGRSTGIRGERDGVPAWSLVSGYAEANGNFVILY